jgi:hypothetical protein
MCRRVEWKQAWPATLSCDVGMDGDSAWALARVRVRSETINQAQEGRPEP